MTRLVLLTEIIAPYRIPVFNTLARREEIDLHVVFLAESDPGLRQWDIYKDDIRFSYQVLPSWRRRLGRYNLLLNWGLSSALDEGSPDAILCGGYNYLASWECLRWAQAREVPFYLWVESTARDRRNGRLLTESFKRSFLRRCSGFVVPGTSSREYLRSFGIADERVFTSPNAVDNNFFASGARAAKQADQNYRTELRLPRRYLLFVGRLVPEKGVFDLVSAYAALPANVREQLSLVFVGDGVARGELERRAAGIAPGNICFAGFAQREELARYYGLAEALVFPTHTDTWGLVVNEAMACGLPVIATSVAGCVADLVEDGWNGRVVSAGDVGALTSAIASLSDQEAVRARMGANSAARIAANSPANWADGVAAMLTKQQVSCHG